jgi:hypothetical protein
VPIGATPFDKGDAEVTTQATGYDSQYGNYVTVNDTSTVTLTKLK